MSARGGKMKADYGVDGRYVRRITDGGEKLYRQQHPLSKPSFVKPDKRVRAEDLIEQIQLDLDDASSQTCFIDTTNFFIPREEFARIMTYQRVLDLVYSLDCFRDQRDEQKREWTDRICFGRSSAPSLKVFAALIGSGLAHEIRKQVDGEQGLNDDCLPLRIEYSGSTSRNKRLVCHKHGVRHKVNEWNKNNRMTFESWTRQLMALYITSKDGKHSHYKMMQGDCLPISRCEEIPKEQIQALSPQYKLSLGGYSDVFQVKIHSSHSDLPKERRQILNRNGTYALKRLTSHNANEFELELSSLLFTANQEGQKNHLIELLITFEVKQPGTGESTFYLLFDWAKGNLNEFWKQNPDLVGNPKHGLWMATQFHGLAEALEVVHNDRTRTLHRLPPDVSAKPDLYGRHGDITPRNLLVFESKKGETVLVLADFGLGKLHTQVSRSHQNPNGMPRTETYRPPEFDFKGGEVSPASDIFSLGCVFLEHISFYLKGPDALDQFSKDRAEDDIHGFEADTFFRIDVQNGVHVPTLKPQVKDWIQELKHDQNCTKYVFQMLELIESKMLDPNPKTRLRADGIVKKLSVLLKSCEVSKTFYLMPMSEDNQMEELNEGWVKWVMKRLTGVITLLFYLFWWNSWSRTGDD